MPCSFLLFKLSDVANQLPSLLIGEQGLVGGHRRSAFSHFPENCSIAFILYFDGQEIGGMCLKGYARGAVAFSDFTALSLF